MKEKNNNPCSANIIAQHLTKPETISKQFNNFFVNFLNQDLLNSAGMQKRSGAKATDIIKDILRLRLNNISIGTNRISLTVDTTNKADVIYTYQKRAGNDVIKLTTALAREVFESINPKEAQSLLDGGLFIVDDTTYKRSYSQETELASSQFDHTTGKFYTGFRNNQLSYYNDGIFLPVNAVPVSTSDPKKAVCPARNTNSKVGKEKRKLTQTKMTEVTLSQIDLALKSGFKARYCLFDSWYASPRMFSNLLERNIFGIGMIKNSSKVKFRVDGEQLSTKEIFSRNAYNPEQLLRDDFFFSIIVEAEFNDQIFPLKLCFYEAEDKNRDFICLGTTDTDLSSKAIKKLYKTRWSTEIYFAETKDVKSLNSTKQCQCQSLDSIYFDIAMTEVLYLFLVTILYLNKEDVSLRNIFHKVSEGFKNVRNYQKTVEIVSFLLEKLSSKYKLSKEELILFSSEELSKCPDLVQQFELASQFLNID